MSDDRKEFYQKKWNASVSKMSKKNSFFGEDKDDSQSGERFGVNLSKSQHTKNVQRSNYIFIDDLCSKND